MQDEVKKAVEALKKGATLLYPTDTIWGIGCDATNSSAVENIYLLKERDPNHSMLILVSDIGMAEQYLEEMPEVAYQLFECADQPLTLVLDGACRVASNLPARDGSIGMRIPDDEFCQQVLRQFRKPIVSTSANFSGQVSARCFREINKDLLKRIDHVVCWRQEESPSKKASSLVKIKPGGGITILRK